MSDEEAVEELRARKATQVQREEKENRRQKKLHKEKSYHSFTVEI